VRGRNLIPDARFLYLSLGPHQPLRKRSLGQQERLCDFRSAQTAQRPKRQRNLCPLIQCRVTTSEDQSQSVVGKMHDLLFYVQIVWGGDRWCLVSKRILFLLGSRCSPAAIDELPVCYGGDPGGGVARNSRLRPRSQRGSERLLHSLLGPVERTGYPDQGRDDPSRLLAEDRFHRPFSVNRRHQVSRWLLNFMNRPYFDTAFAAATSGRNLLCPIDRLVEVLTIKNVVTRKLFLRFCKRSVGG